MISPSERERRESYTERMSARIGEFLTLIPADIVNRDDFLETLDVASSGFLQAERAFLEGRLDKTALDHAALACLLQIRREVEARDGTLPERFPTAAVVTDGEGPGDEPPWMRDGAWNGFETGEGSIFHPPPPEPPPPWPEDAPPPDEDDYIPMD